MVVMATHLHLKSCTYTLTPDYQAGVLSSGSGGVHIPQDLLTAAAAADSFVVRGFEQYCFGFTRVDVKCKYDHGFTVLPQWSSLNLALLKSSQS